jgi:hypothetical protein
MKEDEAQNKWCPMVRYLAVFVNDSGKRECSGGYNRGAEDSGINKARCIASDCMMWRSRGKYLSATTGQFQESDSGWCGLAGDP